MKTERLVIRCRKETKDLFRKVVALMGATDYEDALLRLVRDSGWLERLRLLELHKKIFD